MNIELKYDGVNSNRVNVWKSLGRMFKKPQCSWDNSIFERAYKLVKRVLSPYFKDGLQYSPDITPDASCGLWWKYHGFKTKDDVLRCPTFWKSHKECRNGEREYPPYSCSGKREYLSKSELLEDKIRTFLIAPLELIVDEKFLYGTQDANLKKFQPGWIRYGMNMHNGGYDSFIRRTLSDFFVEWDVRGWDRLLPILRQVMQLRNECLEEALGPEMWIQIRPIAERVSEALVNHKVLLPNGDVVQWNWSQMSGDGMTTSNNCIAHSLIFAYLLIKADPAASDLEILKQLANLYGDDLFAGLQNKFSKIKDESFVNAVYGEFGLGVKPGTFKCQVDPVGMSFLGATCRSFYYRKEPFFAPSYNKDRVLAAHVSSLDPLDLDAEVMKQYSLLDIGWFDCYEPIRKYLEWLLKCPTASPVVESFRRVGIPERWEIRNRWAGIGF